MRYLRQKDIMPMEILKHCRASVIGVGAIGRQVSIQLAAMGTPWIQLIDFDSVEEVNLACQGYCESNLGQSKVSATASLLAQLNSEVQVEQVDGRYRKSLDVGNVVFCCVDSITARKHVWEGVKAKANFFCDGRMSAEVLRVLAVGCEQSRKSYPLTLFEASEAYRGACTARSTIYCANIAAGLMVGQFAKWLRKLPVEADISMNLLGMELSA